MKASSLSLLIRTFLAIAIAAGSLSGAAIAQDTMPSDFAGTWVLSDDTTGDVGLDSIVLLAAGSGLRVERKGSGQRPAVDYEPASNGTYFLAEDSSTNPISGTAAEWIRIDTDGIHIHHMETTATGGIEIVTEELFPTPDNPEVINYRRLGFVDGVPMGESSGTFMREP